MRHLLICIFLLLGLSIYAQSNPYFVEESYNISELSGHTITDYYHSDDMYIYVLSTFVSNDYLTKIDTLGSVLWSKKTGTSGYKNIFYDRTDKRIVINIGGAAQVFDTNGVSIKSYSFPDSLTLVASNDGKEIFSRVQVNNITYIDIDGNLQILRANYYLYLYQYNGLDSLSMLSTIAMQSPSFGPSAVSTFINLNQVDQFGNDYFDINVKFGQTAYFAYESRRRSAMIRFNWEGKVIQEVVSEDFDDPTGPYYSKFVKFLHSGRVVSYEYNSWGAIQADLEECNLEYYFNAKFATFNNYLTQAAEINEDIILFGPYDVKNCGGNILVNQKINLPNLREKYKRSIDHRGVLYGFNGNVLDLLKWNFEDVDGDGYSANYGDCDDLDSLINPAQIEIPFNGVDDDCNPLTLDDDGDQDGYTDTDDCDDNNFAINPGQAEIPYNGVDDDCDQNTLDDDLDQDGYVLYEDCNDQDSLINPSMIEIPNNGIDDDCNPNTRDVVYYRELYSFKTESGTDSLINEEVVDKRSTKLKLSNSKIHPNPTNGDVYIETHENVKLTVNSSIGELLFEEKISNNHILNLGQYPDGIYFIILKSQDGQVFVKKLIKAN